MAIASSYEFGKFNPTEARKSVGSARLEKDDFVINDVPLTIPPEQIHISKQSTFHEWQTLRTRSSQIAKSGRGLLYVAVDIVFKDLSSLIDLVAGLRAAPFCVVHNKYLEDQLRTIQQVVEAPVRYEQLQPIVLAWTSLNFSTMGHEGYVDCIRGRLEFIYFNYFPYTPVYAFKTGALDNTPGPVWQSGLWWAFYQPFVREATRPKLWPPLPGQEYTTILNFKEFMSVPADPESDVSTQELKNIMSNKPQMSTSSDVFDYKKQSLPMSMSATAELQHRTEASFSSLLQEGGWTHLKELDLNPKLKARGQEAVLNPLHIYGRNRQLSLSADNETIIEQIAVSFRNVLAIIPMAGYAYPTCQHTGSIDAEVTFTINATNAATARINKAYDLLEQMSLRYKQIPQGMRNVFVSNDILGLFGLKEFILKGISSTTIPEQPGRSSVILEMRQAGLTTKTTLDDPENIAQEYIQSDDRLRRKVYDILARYLKEGDPRRDTKKDKDIDGWKLVRWNIVPDGYNQALIDQIDKARDAYNDMLAKVHKRVFWVRDFVQRKSRTPADKWEDLGRSVAIERSYKTTLRTEAGVVYYALNEALAGNYGFAPQIDRVRRTVNDRFAGSIDAAGIAKAGGVNPLASRNLLDFYKGPKLSQEEVAKELDVIGYFTYQRTIREVCDAIIENYLDLPQFKEIAPQKDKLGLNKGKTAYPDFALQLQSMAAYGGGSPSFTGENLIDYDPDGYMWFPAYDGAQSTTVEDMVDARLLSIAKQHSISVFETAQGKVGKFFEEEYLDRIAKSVIVAGRRDHNPHKELLNNLKKLGSEKGELPKPIYDNTAITNSLSGEKVVHSVCPDPKKAQTNWFKVINQPLTCDNVLTHTTNVSDMWAGTSQSSDSPGDREYHPPTSAPSLDKAIQTGKTNQGSGRGSGKGVEATRFSWPRDDSKQKQADPTLSLCCPVAFYYTSTKTNSLSMRDVGIRNEAHAFNTYRKKAVAKDWNLYPQLRKEFYDPTKAAQEVGKPVSSWTWEEYTKWKASGRGRKLGYLHKGIDRGCPVGTDVYAVADGVVHYVQEKAIDGAGVWIMVAHHGPGPLRLSVYMHLQAIAPGLHRGISVTAGQCIAVSGRSGSQKMAPHLHFEVWADKNRTKLLHPENDISIPWETGRNTAKRWTPPKGSVQAKQVEALSGQSTGKDVTSAVAAPLVEAAKELALELKTGQAQRLVRAYPAFKLYFIEDDSGERKRLAFDDFFSYNAVKSIRVVRSREIAADLCVIELTNVSGVLSNRKFKQDTYVPGSGTGSDSVRSIDGKPRTAEGKIAEEGKVATHANTANENPIASLMLQEGIQISLRLGYASDPALLELVFTGQITNVEFSENEDLVILTAQSYASELVADIKGVEPVVEKSPWWDFWGFRDNASTGRIIEEMLASPEVLHFGRWEPNTSGTPNRDLLTDKWQFTPNPVDDNIFAPNPEIEKNTFGKGLIFKDMKYVIYRTTIWDICKEMEMRHPNFITAPVPYQDKYGDRMTLFFGLPNQLYFARHPDPKEQKAQNNLRALLNKVENEYRAKRGGQLKTFGRFTGIPISPDLIEGLVSKPASEALRTIHNRVLQPYKAKMLAVARQAGYIRPFRNYHLITSNHHIVSNNIQTNTRDVANTIVITYPEDIEVNVGVPFASVSATKKKAFILKLDNAIPTEDMRTQYGDFINATNETLAHRYALSMLADNMRYGYKGDITIIGNPKIKPRDTVYVCDTESDMVGPVDVRQVTHTFSQQTGFLTEIVPDMAVSVADWSLVGSDEAMGIITAGIANEVFGIVGAGVKKQSSQAYAISGAAVSLMLGSLVTDKILNFTQLGFPLIITPLLHHGRPFAGGIPIRKIPTSMWKTVFGEWYSDVDGAFSDWWEDTKDGYIKMIKKATFQYSTGSFWRGFRGRSFEV